MKATISTMSSTSGHRILVLYSLPNQQKAQSGIHTATYSVTTAGGKVSTFSLVFEVDCAITNVVITQDTSVNVLLKEDGSNFVADASGNIIFEVPKASTLNKVLINSAAFTLSHACPIEKYSEFTEITSGTHGLTLGVSPCSAAGGITVACRTITVVNIDSRLIGSTTNSEY